MTNVTNISDCEDINLTSSENASATKTFILLDVIVPRKNKESDQKNVETLLVSMNTMWKLWIKTINIDTSLKQ